MASRYSYFHLSGFKTRRDPVDTSHDIEIQPGSARDVDDGGDIDVTSVLTKQIDADWASGDNAGGRANNFTLNADDDIHIFALGNGAGSGDFAFDSDINGSNVDADTAISGAGFTLKRRVWTIFTDSSSNIWDYTQYNNMCWVQTVGTVVNDTTPPVSATAYTCQFVPKGHMVYSCVTCYINATDKSCNTFYTPQMTWPSGGAGSAMYFEYGGFYGVDFNATEEPWGARQFDMVPTNSSGQIGIYCNQSSVDIFQYRDWGFVDPNLLGVG